jgi:hypothetical protein
MLIATTSWHDHWLQDVKVWRSRAETQYPLSHGTGSGLLLSRNRASICDKQEGMGTQAKPISTSCSPPDLLFISKPATPSAQQAPTTTKKNLTSVTRFKTSTTNPSYFKFNQESPNLQDVLHQGPRPRHHGHCGCKRHCPSSSPSSSPEACYAPVQPPDYPMRRWRFP